MTAPLAPVTFRGLAFVKQHIDAGSFSGRPDLDLSAPALVPSFSDQLRDGARAALRSGATPHGSAPRPVRFRVAESGGLGSAKPDPLANPQTAFPLDAEPPSFEDPAFRDRRRVRWRLRRGLSFITGIERIKFCGSPRGGLVGVQHSDTAGAGFAGLQTCGSVWACPVCAPKIGAHRAHEMSLVLSAARKAGYRVGMVTLSIRHKQSDSLKDLWDTVAGAWTSMLTGRKWGKLQADYGVLGFTRTVEATLGAHGWHVHIHALILLKGDLEGDLGLGEHLYARWNAAVERRGFTTDRKAFHVMMCEADDRAIADYLAKQADGGIGSLAREATMSASKVGRKRESRSPFGLLADVVERGSAADVARLPDRERKRAQADFKRWQEWETVSRRRRALTWSKGLREWARLSVEKTDEEVAAEEIAGDTVVLIDADVFRELRRADLLCELLEVVEDSAGSPTVVGAWLDSGGFAWQAAPDRPDR